jgi:starvation-inducible DNA-binding protein
MQKINIGINESDRQEIALQLSKLLADTYTLYLLTHNFHWNVRGPLFQSLHSMFETQYTELAAAVDLIAERIRALGVIAPGSYREFSKLSSVQESEGGLNAKEMVRKLTEANDSHGARGVCGR